MFDKNPSRTTIMFKLFFFYLDASRTSTISGLFKVSVGQQQYLGFFFYVSRTLTISELLFLDVSRTLTIFRLFKMPAGQQPYLDFLSKVIICFQRKYLKGNLY